MKRLKHIPRMLLPLLCAFLLATLFSISATPTQSAQAAAQVNKTVQFPVSQANWNTGIDIPAGQVTFSASGTVAVAPKCPSGSLCSFVPGSVEPQGDQSCTAVNSSDSHYPAPGLTCSSLLGKIGTGGKYFLIGSGRTVTLPAGRLYLTANIPSNIGVYDGFWSVTVITASNRVDKQKKLKELAELIGTIVSTSHKLCDVLKCKERVAVPLSRLDKLQTIGNLSLAAGQVVILSQKLDALMKAKKQFGPHSHQACVAGKSVFVAIRNLHKTLLDLAPGLEFIFPLPAGETTACR